ncbi:tetratricopeptide repeat-containing sulfotransferase family protein [Stakelama marina]|uniref:Sulfotransferase n=1 Tax=Stakelama marina TaxID=2826939 RepID=A0A8T4IHM3_9SPHN|nr:tetratricopeptide repeat-containing sulfotransferase family protein [Stakelama marina]MBR0551716.1 sulfotransferase [Stakelama marina]
MTTADDRIRLYPLLGEAETIMHDGRLEEAARLVMSHLGRHRNEPRGTALLGRIAMRLGALMQSELFLTRALEAGIRDFEVRYELASVLDQQQRLTEADQHFAQLVEETNNVELKARRALVLDKLGHHERALQLLQETTADRPDDPQYWIGLATSLRAAGRVSEAVSAYRRALSLDFERGEAWWGLASIKKQIFGDDDIKRMQEAIRIAVDVRNIAPLNFALARALHDRGDHREAFEHYSEGNRLRAEDLAYNSNELTKEVAELKQTIDASTVQSFSKTPVGEVIPIFIVSLPRSGSTLLEQMLASHSDIEALGELPYIPAILRSMMEMVTRRSRMTVPQLLTALTPDQAEAMGQDYLRRASVHRKTDKDYIVDKLPHNWSNILLVRRMLPQARFIDIRRNAMDCCFSNFTQSFSSAHASSFRLADIGKCYRDYVDLMDHINDIAPNLVHHVDYEALVENAEPRLREIFAYLGLPWDPATLEFHKLDRVVRTPSSEQVRRPLNRDGIAVWKPYKEWLSPLTEVLGPLALK